MSGKSVCPLPIESLNNSYKRISKVRLTFPSIHSLKKSVYLASKIIKTLRKMDMRLENNESYIPNYVRTDLTDDLHDKFGFITDFEVISKKILKKFKKN